MCQLMGKKMLRYNNLKRMTTHQHEMETSGPPFINSLLPVHSDVIFDGLFPHKGGKDCLIDAII
jgi:hypothetical protein